MVEKRLLQIRREEKTEPISPDKRQDHCGPSKVWQSVDGSIQKEVDHPSRFGTSSRSQECIRFTDKDIQRNLERKKYIEERLSELPRPLPTLADLPKKLWWNVFIDVPYHESAMKASDPGKLFDNDRSPGYEQSMKEVFDTYIVHDENRQLPLNYESYTALHQCATKYIRHKEFGGYQHEWMGKPNGISSDQPFTYTRLAPIPKEGPERQERLMALEEMRNEKINGLPLYVDYPHYDVEKQQWHKEMSKHSTYDLLEMSCDHGFMHLKNNAPNMQELLRELALDDKPQGIIMGVPSSHDGTIGTIPLYSPKESRALVNAILEKHNDQKKAERTPYEIVMDTVKTVRNLYVLHPKYDGMRRTNVYLFLNKELVAQGLCPTMLPHGPAVFGGLKTLASLAKDVVEGMHLYVETVRKSQALSQEGSLPDVARQQDSSRAAQKDFDQQIEIARTVEGKIRLEDHTLKYLQSANKKQWLAGTIDKLAMIYHGMDIIKRYERDSGFKDLFMENSAQFFKDSPFIEKYGVPAEDSAGKVFMERHGIEFLKLDLGKEWLKGEDGQRWTASYSGKIFKMKHKEELLNQV